MHGKRQEWGNASMNGIESRERFAKGNVRCVASAASAGCGAARKIMSIYLSLAPANLHTHLLAEQGFVRRI